MNITAAWFRGIGDPSVRGGLDYRMGWYVIVGSIPIVIAGLAGESLITGALRNLWWVAGGTDRLERRDGARRALRHPGAARAGPDHA